MAEALLKEVAKEKHKEIEVYSCGTTAVDGDISTYEAVEVLKEEYNVDLSQHRATNIRNAKHLQDVDFILCATRTHKMIVNQMYPNLSQKVYTIKEFVNGANEDMDIADPWGYGLETYRICAAEILNLMYKIIDKI